MNPYQKRDRDQCPSCLHRQSKWKAVNSLGKYYCPKCSTRLTVQTPKRYIYIFTVTGFIFLGLMWWFDTLLISAPIFTAGNFFVLWKFGYLEEK